MGMGMGISNHAVCKWLGKLDEASKITGRPMSPGPLLEGFVRDAGFENMHHKRFRMPLGPWPKDPAYKELGLYNITQFEDGVEGFSLALLVGVLGWTVDEVKAVVEEVKKDTRDPRLRIQFDLWSSFFQCDSCCSEVPGNTNVSLSHVVYGQKIL